MFIIEMEREERGAQRERERERGRESDDILKRGRKEGFLIERNSQVISHPRGLFSPSIYTHYF